MVHQHFMLVPAMTVAENLLLETVTPTCRPLPRDAINKATQMASELGWQLDTDAKTSELSVGQQQRVELIKALQHDPSILILDEPTAVLSPHEVGDLFELLRQLASGGRTIIIIAHKLSEVLAIADHITVLRRGQVTLSTPAKEASAESIAEAMVGGSINQVCAPTSGTQRPIGTAESISVDDVVRGLSLELHEGEILGIGGVDGNGQLELAEALAGVRPITSGTITGFERAAFIPQDRTHDGLALAMSIEDNLVLGGLENPTVFRRGWRQSASAGNWARQLAKTFDVRTDSISVPARNLSGGNQQKVVLARALVGAPKIVVAVNPTRGLDFRASEFVLRQLSAVAERGGGVVLFSTDADELQQVCSRVLFMSRGKLTNSWSEALTG